MDKNGHKVDKNGQKTDKQLTDIPRAAIAYQLPATKNEQKRTKS